MDLRNGDADPPGFRHLPSLDRLTRLTALNLADNAFVRMPACLNKLKALSYLDLSLNADLQVCPACAHFSGRARKSPFGCVSRLCLSEAIQAITRGVCITISSCVSPQRGVCSIYSAVLRSCFRCGSAMQWLHCCLQGFSWLAREPFFAQ